MVYIDEFGRYGQKLVNNDGYHAKVALCLIYFAILVFMMFYRDGEEPRRSVRSTNQESKKKGYEVIENANEKLEDNKFDYPNYDDVLLIDSNRNRESSETFADGTVGRSGGDVESISIQIGKFGDESFNDESAALLG